MGTILVSRLRDDAVGWIPFVPVSGSKRGKGRPRKHQEKVRPAQLLKTLPLQTASICLYGTVRLVEYVTAEVYLRHVNLPVRVVVVKTGSKPLILFSTSVLMRAEDIIELYGARFSIEGALRNLKGEMGLNDYQQTSTSGFYRFVNLTCLAYSLWRIVALISPPALWSSGFKKKPYISREADSMGFIRDILRQRAVKVIINAHSAPHADLKKNEKLCNELLRMAA